MPVSFVRFLSFLLFVLAVQSAQAATCMTRNNGNWAAANRWNCAPGTSNGPPQNGDTAVVNHTMTLNTSTNDLAALTVNAGASIADDGISRAIYLAGALTNNGSITLRSGTNGRIVLLSNSQWGGSGAVTLEYVDLASSPLTFSAGSTLTLQLADASPLRNVDYDFFNPTGNASATLWLDGSTAQTINAAVLRVPNLRLSNGVKIIGSTSQFYILGNLTVDSGATFSAAANKPSVFASGNLVLSGAFFSGDQRWTFNGANAQSISAATIFRMVTLDNPQGLSIGGDMSIGDVSWGDIELKRGRLVTGNNSLIVPRFCSGNGWFSRTAGSWVNGKVQLTTPSNDATCVFPIGDVNNYAPLTFSYPWSNPPLGGRVVASTTAGDHPDSVAALSGIDAGKSVNRYWTLTPLAGASYYSFDVTLQYCAATGTADCALNDVDAAANAANFMAAEKVSAAWTTYTPTAPTSASRRVSGLAGFGDFVIGEIQPPAARLSKTVSTPSAVIGDVVTFTVTANNPFSQALPAFEVSDVLPAGGVLTASAASSGTIATSGQTVTWSVPGLPAGGSAQLTLAVRMTQRGVYTNTATTPNAVPASASLTVLPGAITHFRMDEPVGAWTGAANEVIDSGGTGLNGRRITTTSPTATNTLTPVPTIKSQYPSVAGDFCNAGSFDGGGVVRVANNPKFDYTTQLSASAWIYPTAYPSGASDLFSILSNDRNYEFHLTPSGKLYWWWEASTLTSATTIPLNQWTHVAITFNSTAAGRRQIIYINGVPDANTNNWQGTLSPNLCDFHIGGDVATGSCTLRAERNFRGRVDEAKLYDYEMGASEVRADMLLGRICPGAAPLDHIRIEHDGTASICTPESVTIKACLDSSCSTLYTGSVTTTLSPSGWTGGDNVTFSGGLTSKQLGRSTSGNVTLGSGSTAPTPTTATRCFKGSTETCTLNFAAASCTFDAVEVAASPKSRIFTKVSDLAFNLDVLALTTSGVINTGYTGTVAVDLVDASASACPSTGGLSGTSSNLSFAAANAGRKSVAFNYASAAPVVRVRMREGASAPACSTDSFTIRPQGFSAVSSSANADAAGANVSATPAVQTGAVFTLTANTGKPGYNGLPKANASLLEWFGAPAGGRVAPGTGVLDGSAPGNLSFSTAAAAGTGNGASGGFTYDETGYFSFKVQGVYDDTFTTASGDLANNDCIVGSYANTLSAGKYGCNFGNTAVTSHFGRFIPDHFDTAVTQACSPGNFTYSGQGIPLTITARNLSGGLAQNYSGTFSKQVTLSARDIGDTADNPGPGAFVANQIAAGAFAGGVANQTPTYRFTNAQTAPTSVRIRAADGEVTSLRSPAASSVEGAANLRSGRVRLQNVNGSELLPLPVPLQLQFWESAARGWQSNAPDTCTLIGAGNFAFTFGGNLNACETRMQIAGAAPNYTATLSAPGAGNNGWADLTLNLGAVAVGSQCTVVGAPGGAATTANAPWLQFNWVGAVDNPRARATFGVYRSGPVIHRREMYR